MSKYYKQAIDALEAITESNFREIIVHIAKNNPAALVSAAQCLSPWVEECRSLVKAGKKIDAIKLWRRCTGDGLKESKESVEALA